MSACRFAPGSRWKMRPGNLLPHYDGAIFVIDRADSDDPVETPAVHGHWILPGSVIRCAEDVGLWRYGVSRQRLAALATRLGEGEVEAPAQPRTFFPPTTLLNVLFGSGSISVRFTIDGNFCIERDDDL